jgi:hypothetical protein
VHLDLKVVREQLVQSVLRVMLARAEQPVSLVNRVSRETPDPVDHRESRDRPELRVPREPPDPSGKTASRVPQVRLDRLVQQVK